ncbi:MAG: hypothetical protein JXO72_08555 [Vicinamibacteria bacterium]|nr:hypothetical protein [Vicinamibacteria bacterium]
MLADGSAASEGDRLGLNIEAGSRTSVGVTYRAHERLALRPSITFQWLQADNVPTYIDPNEDYPVFKTTERVLQAGIGALFYAFPTNDHGIRPYIGIDLYLGHQNLPYQIMIDGAIVYRNGSLHQMSTRGFLGMQLPLVRRICLYGELGTEYSKRERFGYGGKKLDIQYFGSFTSGIGVILFVF